MNLFYIDSWIVIFAFLTDLILGDPKKFHPILLIGRLIEKTESFLRKTVSHEKFAGILLFFIVTTVTFLAASVFTHFFKKISKASEVSNFVTWILFIYVCSLFIALRGLIKEADKVNKLLKQGDLTSARQACQALVGRDTEKLSSEKIKIAVTESLAENLSDAVIAPLFYLIVGGFPFLVLYKTVNTLDSMVGYKNRRYINFGWFSAKMDDFFNYIPARISGLMIVLSSAILLGFLSAKNSLKTMLRDGRKHPSPNSGVPEAAIAGALGVKLGGPNYYGGVLVEKPYIGEDLIQRENLIELSQKLVFLSSTIFLAIAVILRSIL